MLRLIEDEIDLLPSRVAEGLTPEQVEAMGRNRELFEAWLPLNTKRDVVSLDYGGDEYVVPVYHAGSDDRRYDGLFCGVGGLLFALHGQELAESEVPVPVHFGDELQWSDRALYCIPDEFLPSYLGHKPQVFGVVVANGEVYIASECARKSFFNELKKADFKRRCELFGKWGFRLGKICRDGINLEGLCVPTNYRIKDGEVVLQHSSAERVRPDDESGAAALVRMLFYSSVHKIIKKHIKKTSYAVAFQEGLGLGFYGRERYFDVKTNIMIHLGRLTEYFDLR